MRTNLSKSKEELVGAVCTQSGFTERVDRYLDDPLNDPEAEEIEDHLLDCRACREFVDTMLSVRGEGARAANSNGQSIKDRQLTRIATYRRSRLQK